MTDQPDEKAKACLSPEARDDLVHDLHVHQTELKMQNEELRRIEQELEAALVRYFNLYDLAPVGFITLNDQGLILEANLTMCTQLKTHRKDLVNCPLSRFIFAGDQDNYYRYYIKQLQAFSHNAGLSAKNQVCALRLVDKQGQPFWARMDSQVFTDEATKTLRLHLAVTDISEAKGLEEALARKSREWSTTFDALMDAVVLVDDQHTIQRCNRAFAQLTGRSFPDLVGKNYYEMIHGTGGPVEGYPLWSNVSTEGHQVFELAIGQRTFSVTVDPILNDPGQLTGAVHVLSDITARKLAETARSQAEEKYRSIVENAVEGIFQTTSDGKFLMANSAVARFHGYGSVEELIHSITDIRDKLYVNPEDRNVYRRVLNTQGWVKGFEARFYRRDGTICWGSMNVRSVRDGVGNLLYYEGTIEDITSRKEAEETRDRTLERLRRSLEGTISTLAQATEIRDPYTAGHQRRVSDLARSIAAAMGLPADQVDGLRMAGVIHDIGKIAIPAEILSTPRILTVIEYGLIKTHPQVAFDILKEIEFPWPIARIIHQHHERMDGSGYPQGLRGEEILIEARILAVADVMEAIASHRPYRPALGIEVALQEIEKHKGIHYDPEVVEACLKLFDEGGYTWVR